jgi:hypothetical protein
MKAKLERDLRMDLRLNRNKVDHVRPFILATSRRVMIPPDSGHC